MSLEIVKKLETRIEDRSLTLGVIGLGYVGLPLIRAFSAAGIRTIGFDVDAEKVKKLQRGESYIRHIDADWIRQTMAAGLFEATAEMARLSEPDAILICVPTPLNETRDPDMRYIVSTADEIAKQLRPGQLIVLESTTYPGTTRELLLPILETSGKKVGEDFFVAYSPEREDPGNATYSAQSIPKIVGGLDSISSRLATKLYAHAVVEAIPVSCCEVAEASKILENTYRCVNIALVNELKVLFERMGIDVWEVIAAAQTKPFGFQAFWPGPGLGGHCIPIDPFYLSWLARKHDLPTRFIELAGEVNLSMPLYVVERTAEALNDHGKPIRGSRIALLGLAYKKNVDDVRESPAFSLYRLLEQRGAILSYHDPFVPKFPRTRHLPPIEQQSQPLTAEFLDSQDAVLIVTDHTQVDYDFVVRHAKLVIDTRNATHAVHEQRDKIYKA